MAIQQRGEAALWVELMTVTLSGGGAGDMWCINSEVRGRGHLCWLLLLAVTKKGHAVKKTLMKTPPFPSCPNANVSQWVFPVSVYRQARQLVVAGHDAMLQQQQPAQSADQLIPAQLMPRLVCACFATQSCKPCLSRIKMDLLVYSDVW